jgi:hypothetical protein
MKIRVQRRFSCRTYPSKSRRRFFTEYRLKILSTNSRVIKPKIILKYLETSEQLQGQFKNELDTLLKSYNLILKSVIFIIKKIKKDTKDYELKFLNYVVSDVDSIFDKVKIVAALYIPFIIKALVQSFSNIDQN